jgi:uncharacterized protein
MKSTFPIIIAVFLLNACGVLTPVKDASVNYVLDPIIPARQATRPKPAIAIARPSLPGYLDRQQLVSRSTDGQILMNGYHVWSEPLDVAISRVTSANLSRLTGSLNIQPVENFITLDYQTLLEIRISRFETDPSGQVVLECTWKLQPVVGAVADTRQFVTTVPIVGEAHANQAQTARVDAMNEALARLARSIQQAISM